MIKTPIFRFIDSGKILIACGVLLFSPLKVFAVDVPFPGVSYAGITAGGGQNFPNVISINGNVWSVNVTSPGWSQGQSVFETNQSPCCLNNVWPNARGVYINYGIRGEANTLTFTFTRVAGAAPLVIVAHQGEQSGHERDTVVTTGSAWGLLYNVGHEATSLAGQTAIFEDSVGSWGNWAVTTELASGSTITYTYEYNPLSQANVGSVGRNMISFQVGSTDYGDAPDATNGTGVQNYETQQSDLGASHAIPTDLNGNDVNRNYLGSIKPDGDSGLLQNVGATADGADEDGITFSNYNGTSTYTVSIHYVSDGFAYLCGWIDFDLDGTFEATERYCRSVGASGTTSLPFNASGVVLDSSTFYYSRFRICNVLSECSAPTGGARDGEVEDYRAQIPFNPDFGDAPNSYGTTLASNGARHGIGRITAGSNASDLMLGTIIDIETNGLPSNPAAGDDGDGVDDEDGVDVNSFTTYTQGGGGGPFTSTLDVTVTNNTSSDAQLVCWIDFDQDGTFNDAEERSDPALFSHTLTTQTPYTDTFDAQGNWLIYDPDGGDVTFGFNDTLDTDPELNIQDNDNGARLAVDLSGVASATLTLDYRRVGPVEVTEDLWVLVTDDIGTADAACQSGGVVGSGWAQIATIPGAGGTDSSFLTLGPVAIPGSALTSTAGICLFTNNDAGFSTFDDYRIDDLVIATDTATACTDAGITDGTYTTGNISAGCSGTATMVWPSIPAVPTSGTSYSRCRLTTDASFVAGAAPTATGAVIDGEVEDDLITFSPTAVTIGDVGLESLSVGDYLNAADRDQLQALLASYGMVAEGMDSATLIAALTEFLDPDGDGQVALLHWDTLEERGTIGFYVERQNDGQDWIRVNNDLLPGLITAPMGAEYQLLDPGAQPGTRYQYRLIELEATGNTRSYGPYTLQMP